MVVVVVALVVVVGEPAVVVVVGSASAIVESTTLMVGSESALSALESIGSSVARSDFGSTRPLVGVGF